MNVERRLLLLALLVLVGVSGLGLTLKPEPARAGFCPVCGQEGVRIPEVCEHPECAQWWNDGRSVSMIAVGDCSARECPRAGPELVFVEAPLYRCPRGNLFTTPKHEEPSDD